MDMMSNIEDSITGAVAKEIFDSVDLQVLMSFLRDDGWTQIVLGLNQALLAEQWCEKNITGRYIHGAGVFAFESKDDAAWFKLRWS